MREPRRRSPESSSRRRLDGRRDSRQQPPLTTMPPRAMSPEAMSRDYARTAPSAHRRRAPSSSDSESSSASLLDISRYYPQSTTSRWGGALATFFRAPSERSRRTARKSNRRRRILRLSNSSSSSVNSDLAYGTGYIARPKGYRGHSPRRAAPAPGPSRRRDDGQYADAAYYADASGRPPMTRGKTDEEILEIGRRLSDIARKQNEHDLRTAGRSRPSGLAAAATAAAAVAGASRRHKRRDTSGRGMGASRRDGASSADDSDWESASDDESSDAADSVLAYGSVASQALRPSRPSAVAGRTTAPSAADRASVRGREGSVVDPRLFGPVNSLRGLVTPRPFGGDESSVTNTQYRNFNRLRRVETEPIYENAPMRELHPVAMDDPTRFDAAPPAPPRRSQTSPAPVPLQQPVPKAPVPSIVYDAERLEDASKRGWRSSRHRSQEEAFGEAAVAGVAAAAIGAAMVSDRRSRRDERREERKRDDRKRDDRKRDDRKRDELGGRDRREDYAHPLDKSEKDSKLRDRESDREKERRKAKRDSYSSSNRIDRGQGETRRQEDQGPPRKRRETTTDHVSDPGAGRYRRGEAGVEAEPDRYSDIPRPQGRDSYDPRAPVDPYRPYNADNALGMPSAAPERPLTPTVVTVDREPDFDNWSPKSSNPELRVSHGESFEVDRPVEKAGKEDRGKSRDDRSFDAEGRGTKDARDQSRHVTLPMAAATVASAMAIGRAQSRERRRRETSARDRQDRPDDEVQERANRHYRELEHARKAAEDQVRSHSQDSQRSVVDRWGKDDSVDEPIIVTPPSVEEKDWKTDKGPYGAPDADVRIDNKLYPREADRFRLTGSERGAASFTSRDPSCERERPMLNLVYPTPESSRLPSPSPDPVKHEAGSREPATQSTQSETRSEPVQPTTPKSVSWGENSTKRFEVESPERGEGERSRPLLDRSSQWGIIAAAMAGSSAEPDNEPEPRDWGKASESKPRGVAAAGPEQIFMDDAAAAPPVPGPKPTGADPAHMPGSFGDDIEFAATLAAGLKDTGFDPNIVINDPVYHRRESPPGESEANGDGWTRRPASDFAADLHRQHGSVVGGRSVSEPGFVIGEVESPRDGSSRASVAGEWADVPAKLSKKEKRRLEKLRRESSEASEPAAGGRAVDDEADAASHRDGTRERSKHSRDGDEQYSRSEAERSHSSKDDSFVWDDGARDKQKKNHRGRDSDDTQSRVSIPTDAFDDLQSLRKDSPVDDYDTSKKSKRKSKRHSGDHDSPARSSAPSEVSVASSSKRSSRSKRSSGSRDDFADARDNPPDSRRGRFEDREVSSVVSESRYDRQKRDKHEGKRSSRSYDDDDDAKSVASAPGSSRRSKDSGKKPGGLFSTIFAKDDAKKKSFLDSAGTCGEGVGLASVAAVAAAGLARTQATKSSSETHHQGAEDGRDMDSLDPEIAAREIRPAIDPQYGDLLPLPPSEPGSPRPPPSELPSLPDSRPATPPSQRSLKRDRETPRRWRSQETPVKSPSNTAIPISLRLGQRGTPTPPGPSTFKSPPPGSPAGNANAVTRRQARRISWDSSRAIMPLFLLEHSRHKSADSIPRQPALPMLPPSEPSSRESPSLEAGAAGDSPELVGGGLGNAGLAEAGLRIDTGLASSVGLDHDIAGSQETTPRAEARPELPRWPESASSHGQQEQEGPLPSLGASSPTRQFSSPKASPDVPDDLTSADEHFSDAMEAHSEDSFQEAFASPAQPASEHLAMERRPLQQQSQESVPDTTATSEPAAPEPDEWKSLTAKERKKAKKALKRKGLDTASVATTASAIGAAAAAAGFLAGEATGTQKAAAGQPEPPRDVTEQSSEREDVGRDKENSLPAPEDIETPAELPKDVPVAASETEVPDAAAHGGSSPITEREDPTFALNLESKEARADEPADVDTTAPSTLRDGEGPEAVETALPANAVSDPVGETGSKSPVVTEALPALDEDRGMQLRAEGDVAPSDPPALEGDDQVDRHNANSEHGDIEQQEVLEPPSQPSALVGTEKTTEAEPEHVLEYATAPEVGSNELSSSANSKKNKKKRKKGKAAAAERGDSQAAPDLPASPADGAATDQACDNLNPVEESPDAAREGAIVGEPEAANTAQLTDAVHQDDTEATAASTDKESLEIQETVGAKLPEEVQEAQTEKSDSAGTVFGSIISEEPLQVDHSEPVITPAAAEPAEDEPMAPVTAVDSSTVGTEDSFAVKTSSKKGKKKKGRRQDEAVSTDNDVATTCAAQEPSAETAGSPEKPLDSETKPHGATSPEESATALETDPAPTSRGKKKKSKRKSLQKESDSPSAVHETPKGEAGPTTDLASEDPEVTATHPPAEADTVTAAKTDDQAFGPVLDATSVVPLETSAQNTAFPDAVSAQEIEPAEAAEDSWDQTAASQTAVPEQAQEELVVHDAPLNVEPGESREDINQDMLLDASLQQHDSDPIASKSLPRDGSPVELIQDSAQLEFPQVPDQIISEPLFSQGEIPAEPTQDLNVDPVQGSGSVALEPALSPGPVPVESLQSLNAPDAQPADQTATDAAAPVDETTTASASVDDSNTFKKKVKKGKRKGKGSVQEVQKDEALQEQRLDPDVAKEEAVPEKGAEDAAVETVDEAREAVQNDDPALAPNEAPAGEDHNESVNAKDPDQGADHEASLTTDEALNGDAAPQTTETPVAAEEPASTEGPSLGAQIDPPADVSAAVDEWPEATSKKGKKKKKKNRLSQGSVTLDGESSAPAPLAEGPKAFNAAESTADGDVGSWVPKQGKKAKRQSRKSVSATDPQQPIDESAVSPEGQDAMEAETQNEAESGLTGGLTGDEASSSPDDVRSKSTRDPDQESETPRPETGVTGPGFLSTLSRDTMFPGYSVADSTAADESELPTPIKKSKKDKRNKKRQAALDGAEDASNKLHTTLDIVPEQVRPELDETKDMIFHEPRVSEEAAVGTSPATDPSASGEAALDHAAVSSKQQSEAIPDELGGFSLERSRKDRKKKKAKNNEPTKLQEFETASHPGPEPEEVDTPVEQATVPPTVGTDDLSKDSEPVTASIPKPLAEAEPPLLTAMSEEPAEASGSDQALARDSLAHDETEPPASSATMEQPDVTPAESAPVLSTESQVFDSGLPLEPAAAKEADKVTGSPNDPVVEPEVLVEADSPRRSAEIEGVEKAVEPESAPTGFPSNTTSLDEKATKALPEETVVNEPAEKGSILEVDLGASGRAESPLKSAVPEAPRAGAEVDGIPEGTMGETTEKKGGACIRETTTEARVDDLDVGTASSQIQEQSIEEPPSRSQDNLPGSEDAPVSQPVRSESPAAGDAEHSEDLISAARKESLDVEPVEVKGTSIPAEARDDAPLVEADEGSAQPVAVPSDVVRSAEEPLAGAEARQDTATDESKTPVPCPDTVAAEDASSDHSSPVPEGDMAVARDEGLSAAHQDDLTQESPASRPTEAELPTTAETPKDAAPDKEQVSSRDQDASAETMMALEGPAAEEQRVAEAIVPSELPAAEEQRVPEAVDPSNICLPPELVGQGLESPVEPQGPDASRDQGQSFLEAATVLEQDKEPPVSQINTEAPTTQGQSTDGEWSSSAIRKKGRKTRRGNAAALLKDSEAENPSLPGTDTDPPVGKTERLEPDEPQPDTAPKSLDEVAIPESETTQADVIMATAVEPTPGLDETIPKNCENVASPIEDAVPTQAIEAEEPRGMDQQIESKNAEDASTSSLAHSRDVTRSEEPAEATPDAKLSKKDKKKKTKRGGLGESWAESAAEGSGGSEPMAVTEPQDVSSAVLETVSEKSESMPTTSLESSEDKPSTKKSKRDKKKAQKAALAAASSLAATLALDPGADAKEEKTEETLPAMEPAVMEEKQLSEEMQHMQEPQRAEEPRPAEQAHGPEPTRSWADEVSEAMPLDTAQESPVAPRSAQAAGESEPEAPLKDREGQESGKASSAPVKAEQILEPAGSESQPAGDTSGAAPDADASGKPSQAPEAPTIVHAEDEWSPTVKKKGGKKKNKKSKGGAVLTTETDSGASSQPDSVEPRRQPVEETPSLEPAASLAQPEEPSPAEPHPVSQGPGDGDMCASMAREGESGEGVSAPAIISKASIEPEPVQAVEEMGQQRSSAAEASESSSNREEPKPELPEQAIEVPKDYASVSMTEQLVRVEGRVAESSGIGRPPSAGRASGDEAEDQSLVTEPLRVEEPTQVAETEQPRPELEVKDERPTSQKRKKNKGKKGKGLASLSTEESVSETQDDAEQVMKAENLGEAETRPEDHAAAELRASPKDELQDSSIAGCNVAGDAMDVDAPQGPMDGSSWAEKEPMVVGVSAAPIEASSDSIREASSRKKTKEKKRKSKQQVALTSLTDASGQETSTSSPAMAEEAATTDVEKSERSKRDQETQIGAASLDKTMVDQPAPSTAVSPAPEATEPSPPSTEDKSMPEPAKEAEPSITEKAAAAAALTGGVALLAEKFGGSKKTKNGKRKIVDKRQPQEADIFDDPVLWEGADKKGLEAQQDASSDDNFWGGGWVRAEANQGRKVGGATSGSESWTESEEGGRETARQGAPLRKGSTEMTIQDGTERSLVQAAPAGLLRLGPEVEEPVGGLFKERREGPPTLELKRPASRGLPAVQEFPEAEAEEAEATRRGGSRADSKRDSGFGSGSPKPQPRQGRAAWEQQQHRDSGVDTADAADTDARTPERSGAVHGVKGRRSPYGIALVRGGTPVLRSPAAAETTPEPEKRRQGVRPKKGYGELGAASSSSSSSLLLSSSRQRSSCSGDGGGDDVDSGAKERAETAAAAASNTGMARRHTPERHHGGSAGSASAQGSVVPPASAPASASASVSPAPPLRRMSKRRSGDLRALRRQSSAGSSTANLNLAASASASDSSPPPHPPPPPVANESRARARGADMADVYDGFGEGRMGSPRSPTRPHSMRRRQSMQVLELEARVEQLQADNALLAEARAHAEHTLGQRAAAVLAERDAEIDALKQSLQFLHNEVGRLTDVNDGLASANADLAAKDAGSRADLELRHAALARDLDDARATSAAALRDKDADIARLGAELDAAREQVRDLQRRLLDAKPAGLDFLDLKDDDYFDARCQQLCSHIQQWVLRFSKFSDMRACRLTSEISDEKTIDRLDNAVLDGSDVDSYLNDRVRRRDVFMSMTMNMIWEFVFTRYLFGMDREQRQKLKSLEKLLVDVGPAQAVRQWRAVTLTLLCRRPSFQEQRGLDTEAVVQAIFQTLSKILPPPGNLEAQIQSQLRRVMREAVQLSIEMRTQRAEYMMLPPLQPEYDADGELAASVYFDATMMNERGGASSLTNQELEAQGAVVRVVLFPLVVKRGDDDGVGDDKLVVFPAQVLVARDAAKHHLAPSSDAGGASLGAQSRVSVVTEHSMAPSDGYGLAADV